MKHSIIMGLLMLALSFPCHANEKPMSNINFVDPNAAKDTKQAPEIETAASLYGHYYLSGVMETGSELILKTGGRFEWSLSYGAVDRSSQGKWSSDGTTVTLSVDPVAQGSIFSIFSLETWEDFNQGIADRQRIAKIKALCPFIPARNDDASDVTPPPPNDAVDFVAVAAAEKALMQAKAARAELEKLAPLALIPGNDRTARVDAAMAAKNAWDTALMDMLSAYKESGRPAPLLEGPTLPTQCEISEEADTESIPRAEWQRGIAIIVGDPIRQLGIQGISMQIEYSDGHHETCVTDDAGGTFFPMRSGTTARMVTLQWPDGAFPPQTVSFHPIEEGVVTVRAEAEVLDLPAFAVLRLAIDGKGLVPDELFGGGRYEK